jgi:uncharacterized membrane protein
MEAKARLLGHPIHQMVIVLPLGLLIAAWLADIGLFASGNSVLAQVAYWNTAGGIVTGLFAAIFGFIDWLAVPIGTRAKRVGAWHAGCNVLMLLLFVGSLLIRHPIIGHLPNTAAFACATAGLLVGMVSGWLGGELVNRLGIGVSENVGLDAPSSLSQSSMH